ncbi:hypothetical protein [Chryseobacterium luquanense]|uniref:Uncharacterized protein n=1 Tax=Chryseobacterium luquanense TaxID=2983766 RepID=A0ABT3Y3L1_9FLAO|nr:hypothetical protein [Chryseobacterium luquanense]MCX8532666.1 hypothetical protein [Chryseobacterium luquanense]
MNFATKTLNECFNDLYDVVLYVFKAENNKTIIEIEYLKKSDLDITYYQQIKHNSPMFHAKISMPPNQNHSKKFDVNWQSNNFYHKLKRMFFNFQ